MWRLFTFRQKKKKGLNLEGIEQGRLFYTKLLISTLLIGGFFFLYIKSPLAGAVPVIELSYSVNHVLVSWAIK